VLVELYTQTDPYRIGIRVWKTVQIVLLVELLELLEADSSDFHASVLQYVEVLQLGGSVLLQYFLFAEVYVNC
jgi:hypothetical protein